jgi:succinate dehydrogenase flavin-adding protein (antitoxin of CptAB toxin-antitoxin module)
VKFLQKKFKEYQVNKKRRYDILYYALNKEIGRLHMKYVKSKNSKKEKALKVIKNDPEILRNVISRYIRFCHDQYVTI